MVRKKMIWSKWSMQCMVKWVKWNGHEDDDEDETNEQVEKELKEIDVSEHVDALMNGEGDLSEEFKEKLQQYLKAVKSKIRDEVAR